MTLDLADAVQGVLHRFLSTLHTICKKVSHSMLNYWHSFCCLASKSKISYALRKEDIEGQTVNFSMQSLITMS